MIAEKKMEILRALSGGALTFEELSKKVSSPLLSYHLNGDRETEGLIEIGLVEYLNDEEKNNKQISLSAMGRLFFKGYCQWQFLQQEVN